jgi:hypothetical protein
MRNTLLATAVVGVLGIAGAAQAASINLGGYGGPIYIKYSNIDTGKIYSADANSAAEADALDSSTLPGGFNGAEDFWGAARVQAIYAGTNDSGALLFQKDLLNQGVQITVMFVGGQDIQVSNNAGAGTQTIFSTGLQVGFFASELANNLDGLNYDETRAPGTRTNVGGVPLYQGVSDGTLVWTLNGINGFLAGNPDASFTSTINPTLLASSTVGAVVGGGSMFLEKTASNVFGTATQNDLLGSVAGGPDVSVQFTVRQGQSGWLTSSDDPALAVAVPTPSAVGMGIAGLVGLGLKSYRRARKAR